MAPPLESDPYRAPGELAPLAPREPAVRLLDSVPEARVATTLHYRVAPRAEALMESADLRLGTPASVQLSARSYERATFRLALTIDYSGWQPQTTKLQRALEVALFFVLYLAAPISLAATSPHWVPVPLVVAAVVLHMVATLVGGLAWDRWRRRRAVERLVTKGLLAFTDSELGP